MRGMPPSSFVPSSVPRLPGDRLRRVASFILVAAFLSAALGAVAIEAISPWVSQAYLAMSLATMVAYGFDKERAGHGGRRTPESLLHLLEFAGGWPGALLAQQLFRHKTRKLQFQLVFWLIVAAHVGAWVWLGVENPQQWQRWLQAR